MREWFGTDGIRGVANTPPMTVETALVLGRALARSARVAPHGADGVARVVVGRDTRASGPMLEAALVAGVAAEGGEVLRLGVLPTAGVALLAVAERATFGVVISASHNPYEDNGLKVFGPDGFKLTDEEEAAVEAGMRAARVNPEGARPGGPRPAPGAVRDVPDAVARYVRHILARFPDGFRLDGLRVALDCAHGAAWAAAPLAFRTLGAQVEPVAVEPDGRNINAGCGALHPEHVAAHVRRTGAHLGVALDGDADRAILVDETGATVDGDELMAICALRMMAAGTLRDRTLVTTVMSNLGLEQAIRAAGGRLVRTAVGDRYVVEAMRAGGYNLGGEQSGHLIFLDRGTTGDGVLAALSVVESLMAERRPLSALRHVMTRLPQTLVNVRVRERAPLEEIPAVAAAVAAVERSLGGDGRVLLRYSGTEPKARVMVEGRDQETVERHAAAIAQAIRDALT
jgi:phosphoglucosamine mutase